MPLYAILVREYFGARIMGTAFGAVSLAATLGMALGPWLGGWLYDALGSYAWLFIGSFGDRPRGGGHRVHVPAAPLASGDAADSERGPLREGGEKDAPEPRSVEHLDDGRIVETFRSTPSSRSRWLAFRCSSITPPTVCLLALRASCPGNIPS